VAAYKVAMVLLAEAELCVDRASGGGGTPGERSLVARIVLPFTIIKINKK